MFIIPDSQSLADEMLQHNRAIILAALTTLGITAAVVSYSGGGDSGDVIHVEVTPQDALHNAQARPVAMKRLFRSYRDGHCHQEIQESQMMLDEALRNFALDWVERHHDGWENNDGASGTLTVEVADNRFKLEHESYYTESIHHAYEL